MHLGGDKTVQDLLVVDDKLIRKRAFAEAQSLLLELDGLEAAVESFVGEDQRLFSQWFGLKLGSLQDAMNKKQNEQEHLMRTFRNILALSKMRRISQEAALQIFEQEDLAYRNGSEEDRARIDGMREQREEFLFSMIENRGVKREPEVASSTLFSRSSAEEAQFRFISRLSNQRIEEICWARDGAFHILANVFNLIRDDQDCLLFLKIWALTPLEHQTYFKKKYRQQTGAHFDPLIEEMRFKVKDLKVEDEDEFELLREDQLPPEEIEPRSEPTEDFEIVRMLYRKLARHLHPDLQVGGAHQEPWKKSVWLRVQQARTNQNKTELERLLQLVNIRTCNFNDVSLSELEQYRHWIGLDIERMKREIKTFKRLPSWGFSRKKNRGPLEQKLKRRLTDNLQRIESEVEALNLQLADLESKALQNLKLRKRRGARLTYDGPEQMNFAF